MAGRQGGRYGWVRLMMILNSFAPLFLLWALRGQSPFSQSTLFLLCGLSIAIPPMLVLARIRAAQNVERPQMLEVGKSEDGRDHLLVYLFATLLPFYATDMSQPRDFAALVVALLFVIFLFWYLDLHYVNILFAVLGYRVYTIEPADDGNPFSGRQRLILISKRRALRDSSSLEALQLSDTVYLELDEGE